MTKKPKLGLKVSRLLVSRPLGLIVAGRGEEADFYCTKSGLAPRTDKLRRIVIVYWVVLLLSNQKKGLI